MPALLRLLAHSSFLRIRTMTLRPSSVVAASCYLALLATIASGVPSCSAFHCFHQQQYVAPLRQALTSRQQPRLWATAGDASATSSDAATAAEGAASSSDDEKKPFDTRVMEMFLNQKYPAFMQLLSNQDIWKELSTGDGGYTIFAPNNKAFDKLGDKKLLQLNDPRNLETTEKIGRYHAIAAPVSSKQIYDSNTGGIKTLGGDLPIGKTKKGGFLGFGGEEDGGVTVNGAKILESFEVTNCIVHEVDDLIHPKLLWRYMDQLRIPGT